MTTFDELFAEHRLSIQERELLVHHLASMRYRKLLEMLLPVSPTSPRDKPVITALTGRE